MTATLVLATITHLWALPPPTMPEGPPVVARPAWDPSPAHPTGVTRYHGALRRSLRWLVVHHSSFEEPIGPRGILDYHRQVYGWADMGYHFVIDQAGTIFEGRDIHLMGAHAGQTRECNRQVAAIRAGKSSARVDETRRLDPDFGAIGIVVDGYFDEGRTPSLAQQTALRALVDHLRALYRIDLDHVITHREVRARIIEARGLTSVGEPTLCPGAGLQAVVERYRQHRGAATPR
ncbi:MAG: peptidoglycan recognition family protein [Pseudomonadota bacterium]